MSRVLTPLPSRQVESLWLHSAVARCLKETELLRSASLARSGYPYEGDGGWLRAKSDPSQHEVILLERLVSLRE